MLAHLLQSAMKGDLSRALKGQFNILRSGEKKNRLSIVKNMWEEKQLFDDKAPPAAQAAVVLSVPIK